MKNLSDDPEELREKIKEYVTELNGLKKLYNKLEKEEDEIL